MVMIVATTPLDPGTLGWSCWASVTGTNPSVDARQSSVSTILSVVEHVDNTGFSSSSFLTDHRRRQGTV
jgi:hypothetical protein